MDFIVGFIAFLIIFYFIFKKKKTSNKTKSRPVKHKKISKSKPSVEKEVYKKKGVIRNFEIVGIKHYKLNPEEYRGGGRAFTGSIRIVENPHDKYAVGVFDNNRKQIGITPNNNNILHNSLRKWHKGKCIAWGHLRYDDYLKKWIGRVFVPIGYTSEDIEKFEEILTLEELNKEDLLKKNKITEEYFLILERHRQIVKNLNELNNPEDLYYTFPKNFIPSASKHLEKQKEWDKLIELEAHQDLINNLNEQYKSATERRIELAKSRT